MEILSGILVSLLVLFPPIRRWAQSSENARVTILLTLGILSFFISFGLHMWLNAWFEAYVFAHGFSGSCEGPGGFPASCPEEEFFRKTPNAQTELWIRLMVPPPPSKAPSSREYIPLGWNEYWSEVISVFVRSVPIPVALGALFTRRQVPRAS